MTKEGRKEVISMIKEDLRRTASGDKWAWTQFISAILFVGFILLWADVLNHNFILGWIGFIIFIAWNVFAMYKTWKEES